MEHTPLSQVLPDGLPRALVASEFAALVRASHDRRHGCLLLDTRGAREGRIPRESLPGSAWIRFDSQGRPPVFLMPARGRAVVVVGEGAAAIASSCTELGWPAWWFEGDLTGHPLHAGPPTGALWDIDPHLRAHLGALPEPGVGPVLDLGAGSSREGVFLAQSGYRVLAVDRLADALALATRRAAHHGVTIDTLTRRVGRGDDLPRGPFAAVLFFRFCERAVLTELSGIMAPGGVVVLRTFGQAEAGAPVTAMSGGPRRAARRLVPDDVFTLLGRGWRFIDGPRTEVEGGALWTVTTARWEGE